MRRVICAFVAIGSLAALAVPSALVIASQHRELEVIREQQKEFCFREATLAFSTASLFDATHDPKYRERLALDMLHRHELGTILALCAPSITVDGSKENGCWLLQGDPDCFAPYLRRVVTALEPWRS